MRILLYTRAFAPQVGGQETAVFFLADGLARLGSPDGWVTDITLVTPTLAKGMDDTALPFRVIRQPRISTLVRLMREADMVHLAGPVFLPLALALLLRKPVVIEHHGFQTICPNGQLLYEPTQTPCPGHFMAGRHRECLRCNAREGKWRSWKMWVLTFPRRWLTQHASINISPTNWLANQLRLRRTETIHHGLPPIGSSPVKRAAVQVPTFVFLGRLVSTKGARVLLDAAKQLKSDGCVFRLKIIGEGPDRELLEHLVKESCLQEAVSFLGYVAPERLEEMLADAVAIVIPSLAGEVFGFVAAENMRRGRLVIVSDQGALAEVVGDAGLTFPTGDSCGLAQSMKKVIQYPALAEELGRKAARRALELFDSRKMVAEHLRIYEGLANN